MAFPYDNLPPVRDPALPPLNPPMSDAQAAQVSQQLAQQFGTAIPSVPPQSVPPVNTNNIVTGGPTPITPVGDIGFLQQQGGLIDRSKLNTAAIGNEQIGLNNQTAEVQGNAALQAQKNQEEDARIHAEAQAVAAKHDQEARDMVQKNLAMQIDPDRYWHNKSTGGKILAIIGVGLGGFGSGLTGGQNGALNMFQSAITNDIDAQKANMDAGWKAYDKLHDLNGDEAARNRYNDVWRQTHYTMGTELVKSQLAQIAAKSSNVDIKDRANGLISALDAKQLDARHAVGLKMAAAASASAAANQLRLRKLSEDAGKDVQALTAAGMTEEDARKNVYSRPGYSVLSQVGLAPKEFVDVASTKAQLQAAAIADLQAKKGVLSEAAFKKYQDQKIKEFQAQSEQLDELVKPTATVPGEKLKGIEEAGKLAVKGEAKDESLKQLESDKNQVDLFKKDYKIISPSLVEGVGVHGQSVRARQQEYNSFVYQTVGKIWKAENGGVEPKNQEIIENEAKPYLVPQGTAAYEDPSVTLQRMNDLQHRLDSATAGLTGKTAPIRKEESAVSTALQGSRGAAANPPVINFTPKK